MTWYAYGRYGLRMQDSRRSFLIQVGAGPLIAAAAQAQTGDLSRRTWTARWISVPGAPPNEYGVYLFRRTLTLDRKPERFVIHSSGDQRYRLLVNGRGVAWGPARGDLFHWRYETVDVAPYLEAGKNVFAAVVWNFGELAPEAQVTLQTGFLLQGEAAERMATPGRRGSARATGPIRRSSSPAGRCAATMWPARATG